MRSYTSLQVALLSGLILCASAARSQTTPASSATPPPVLPSKQDSDSDHPLGPIEEELRVKRAIKYREKEYQENLDRAREVAELGEQLNKAYKQNHSLNHEDTKKLDRLEKLTRKIRSDAGGSEEDVSIDSPPQQLEPALARLAEESDCFKTTVEKTPRQVVSAAVIEKANVLLKLIRLARGFIQ